MVDFLLHRITRALAIVPAVSVILYFGEGSATSLLVLSQVILSIQLSFAVIPLIMLNGNKKIMGEFTNPTWLQITVWVIALTVAMLNIYLTYSTLSAPGKKMLLRNRHLPAYPATTG